MVTGVVTWVVLLGIVGLPYWIVLIPLNDLLLGAALRHQLLHSRGLWLTFGLLAAGHVWKAFRAGYGDLPEDALKQRLRGDAYPLVLRAVAMFVIAANMWLFVLVPAMALLLSCLEIWPERIIGAVFGGTASGRPPRSR